MEKVNVRAIRRRRVWRLVAVRQVRLILALTHLPWVTPLSLGLLTLVLFGRVLLATPDEVLFGRDLLRQFYPWFSFLVRSVHQHGEMPLWNPHQFLGYSVLGNPQYALFYPPNWWLYAFRSESVPSGIAWLLAIHVFWGAYGMALLARAWGANPLAGLLAGMIFAFNGGIGARLYAGHYTLLIAAAWIPWLMWAYARALSAPRPAWDWSILGGGMLALQIASGHPQTVYLTGLALLIQTGYALGTARQWREKWRRLRPVLLMGVLGIALSAVVWLPILDEANGLRRAVDSGSYSQRNRHLGRSALAFTDSFGLPWHQLTGTTLFPNFYGSPQKNDYWGFGNYEESSTYWGILPLIFTLLALRHPPLRRQSAFFLALTGVGVVLSLGVDGGLLTLNHYLLPLTALFRAPARALLLTQIGLAGLTALTLTALMRQSSSERAALLRGLLWRDLPLALALLLGAAGLLALTGGHPASPDRLYQPRQILWAAGFVFLSWAGLWLWVNGGRPLRYGLPLFLGAMLWLDLLRVIYPLVSTVPQALPRYWESVQRLPVISEANVGRVLDLTPNGMVNAPTWTGHYAPQGYDPMTPPDWKALGDPRHLQGLYGVRYLLTTTSPAALGLDAGDYRRIYNGFRFDVYSRRDPTPRVTLPTSVYLQPDPVRAAAALYRPDIQRGETAVLAKFPAHCPISGLGGSAIIHHYRPNEVRISVEARGAGLLVLSDQYDEAWRVRVDGQPAELLRVNGLMRGVCVSAGRHTVDLRYRPWSLYVGGGVSLFSFGLLGLGAGIAKHRGRLKRTA